MANYGSNSEKHLIGVHPRVVLGCRQAIRIVDHSIICGLRSNEVQEQLFLQGHTKARAGQSKHNPSVAMPYSLAIDFLPYPFRGWEDEKRFAYIAGTLRGCLLAQGLLTRWGNDWNQNGIFVGDDPMERFKDFPHIEVIRFL